MQKGKRSTNFTTYRNLRTKLRKVDSSPDVQYLLVYAFLYKYCSDSLKDYILSYTENKEITLDEVYRDPALQRDLRNESLRMLGYNLKTPDAFMDELIANCYQDRFFLTTFINSFIDNVEFMKGSNADKYFTFIFDCFKQHIMLNSFESEDSYLLLKDIIYSISKLDIFDDKLPFSQVFDLICQSRAIDVDRDPEYINYLLTELIFASKSYLTNVYNPFLNDASSLIRLSEKYNWAIGDIFGKCNDKLTLCCSLIKLFMNYFSFNGMYLEYENALESVDFNGESFDVIISNIPPVGGWSSRSLNKSQNREYSKRSKRKKLESLLTNELNIDGNSFSEDLQLNNALESLLDRMDLDNDDSLNFVGEYESLKNSEYLFLINLINSLKDDGIMVVAVSQSFLVKNSLETLRKYLTYENNYIDTIISLPEELVRGSRSEVILVIKKNRMSDDILFVDLSKNFETKKAPYLTSGTFRRNLLLSDETISKLMMVYKNRQIIEKYSNVENISEVVANRFNLSVSRYVDTFEGEFIKLEDLSNEKSEITSNIKELNKKIDEMMEELNLRF